MKNTPISLFKKITQTKNGEQIQMNVFLDHIKEGKWQDLVIPIWAMDKEQRELAKKNVPYVTLSGVYEERKDGSASAHSGFIGIDIDDVDPEETKSIICVDKHIYAAFTSISSRGLCLLIKINGDKHREAFAGISEYLYNNYHIICDPTGVNPSRARYVSYDPHLFINPAAEKFALYAKYKAPKKIDKIVYAQNDFEELLKQIQSRGLNICDNYNEWLRIGFAFADRFGEAGRSYFHTVSAASQKYKSNDADRQYNNCLKARGSKLSTIATFYYYCKQAGLAIYSKETNKIKNAAVNLKKSGLNKEAIAKTLKQFENIDESKSEAIISQVFDNNIENSDDNLIVQVEQWLRFNHDIKKNELTRNFEDNSIPLTQYDLNSIYLSGKKIMEKLNYELFDRIINSKNTPIYNPLKDFINKNKHINTSGNIDKLFDSILSEDYTYTRYFGKKWIVGIISSIYGKHSPLMLVLSGSKQNTGKTEFFRRFLPKELGNYYAESKLDAGKDDEILMTQKLLIMDDEMGGKSKKDELRIKELLSRQTFSLREPYGRNNVDLNRLAVLCATTNNQDILNDPTGNRRLLPVKVFSINHDTYNSVCKTSLFMEAYHLYHSGFSWQLTGEDIELLNSKTLGFEKYSMEYEMINKFLSIPTENVFDSMTATEIKNYIETHSVQKLSLDKIGKELQRLGYKQVSKKVGPKTMRLYEVKKLQQGYS